MILSAQFSGQDFTRLGFLPQTDPDDPMRTMAIEGQPGAIGLDTLINFRDGLAQALDVVDAEIDRVALVGRAAAELDRHNEHPFPVADVEHDHTDPDIELYVDASAVRAAGTVA